MEIPPGENRTRARCELGLVGGSLPWWASCKSAGMTRHLPSATKISCLYSEMEKKSALLSCYICQLVLLIKFGGHLILEQALYCKVILLSMDEHMLLMTPGRSHTHMKPFLPGREPAFLWGQPADRVHATPEPPTASWLQEGATAPSKTVQTND